MRWVGWWGCRQPAAYFNIKDIQAGPTFDGYDTFQTTVKIMKKLWDQKAHSIHVNTFGTS